MSTKPVGINAGAHRARVLARRDALVEAHLSLVDGIARQVARSLPPSFDLSDLVGVGNLALVRAATRYRPCAHGGAPFSAFARPSIRGAILDSVRRRHYLENTRPSIDDVAPMSTFPRIEADIDARRLAVRLIEAISWLPEDEQKVLQVYYGHEEPSLAAIARRFGASERRTQASHANAIDGIRRRFRLRAA
jgi:RNA polymerase sigma factor (sigma-70 family)